MMRGARIFFREVSTIISSRETGASGTFVSAELAIVVAREDHQRLYECRSA